MAFIPCPQCNKSISDKAPACPHCGHVARVEENGKDSMPPQDATAEKPEQDAKQTLPAGCGCGLLLFGAILLFVFTAVFFSDSGPDKIGAYVASQQFVEQKLRAPASADFPSYRESMVNELSGGKYRIKAYVDSQNGFGAQIRSHYTCVIRAKGESWHLEALDIH